MGHKSSVQTHWSTLSLFTSVKNSILLWSFDNHNFSPRIGHLSALPHSPNGVLPVLQVHTTLNKNVQRLTSSKIWPYLLASVYFHSISSLLIVILYMSKLTDTNFHTRCLHSNLCLYSKIYAVNREKTEYAIYYIACPACQPP